MQPSRKKGMANPGHRHNTTAAVPFLQPVTGKPPKTPPTKNAAVREGQGVSGLRRKPFMSDINGFKDPAPSPNPTAKSGGFAPARGEEAKKDRPPAALPKRHRGNAVLPKPGRRAQNGGEVTRCPSRDGRQAQAQHHRCGPKPGGINAWRPRRLPCRQVIVSVNIAYRDAVFSNRGESRFVSMPRPKAAVFLKLSGAASCRQNTDLSPDCLFVI
jgi:hypothetical protein